MTNDAHKMMDYEPGIKPPADPLDRIMPFVLVAFLLIAVASITALVRASCIGITEVHAVFIK